MNAEGLRHQSACSSPVGRKMLRHYPTCRGMDEKCWRFSVSSKLLKFRYRTKNASTSSNLSRYAQEMVKVFKLLKLGIGRWMHQHHPACRGMHKKWWRSLNYWSSVSGRWMLQHHPACRGMGEKCCRSSASISMLTTGRTKNSSTSSNLSRLGRGMLTVFGMINDIIVGLSEVKRGDHRNTIILYDWTVTPLHYLQLFLYHGGR